MTCNADQPLSCKDGWFVDSTLYRFPICYPCNDRYDSALTCNDAGPLTCESGLYPLPDDGSDSGDCVEDDSQCTSDADDCCAPYSGYYLAPKFIVDQYFSMLSGRASAIDDWAIVAFYGGKLEGPGYGSNMIETDAGQAKGYFVFDDPNISDMLLVAPDPNTAKMNTIKTMSPGDKSAWPSAPDTLEEGSDLGDEPVFTILKRGDIVPEGPGYTEEATCAAGFDVKWIGGDEGFDNQENCRYTCVTEGSACAAPQPGRSNARRAL